MRKDRVRQDAAGDGTKTGRREFLRRLAGGALIVAVPGLAGCGGGGNNGGNGGGNGGALSVAQRLAALDAINTKAQSLDLRDTVTANQQMLQYLQGRSEFQRVGLSDDGVVWGVFTDGRLYRFINNIHPDPGARSYTPLRSRAAGDSLPKAGRIYVLNGFGTYMDSPEADLRAWLLANGYTQPLGGGGAEATLDALKQVRNAGVLYLSTHGGDGDGGFGFTTVTRVTEALENDPGMKDDLNKGILIYCSIILERKLGGFFDGEVVRVYGFTYTFIEKYMTFAPNSLVYVDACSSDELLVKDKVFKAGGSVYAGWTAPVQAGVLNRAARFAFDRLLGANLADPKEDPPQRPFDYEAVWNDMKQRGLDASPGGANLLFSANSLSPEFGLLAPTIKQMGVDEVMDELILKGTFGHDSGIVRVNNATDLTIKSWGPEKIVCALPPTGPGSAGNVQVIVQQHKSNVRQLTEWKLAIRYRWQDIARPALKVEGPVNLRFRADVGEFRNKPGEEPQSVARYAVATRDSRTTQVAGGTASGGGCSFSWSGTQTFVVPETNPNHVGILVTRLKMDPKTKTGALALAYGHPTGKMFTETDVCPTGTNSFDFAIAFGVLHGQQEFPDPIERPGVPALPAPALNIAFGDDFSLNPMSYDGLEEAIHLEWDRTPAQYPPDPQAARSAP